MPARRAPVVLLQVANLLGGVANSTVAVLVPWLVLQETGSAADAGLVAAAAAIPGIFVSPFVGALVDRFGRRRVSMASDAFSAFSVSLFPLAEGAGVLTLGMILALAVLGATFDPAGYTARKSLIPDVALRRTLLHRPDQRRARGRVRGRMGHRSCARRARHQHDRGRSPRSGSPLPRSCWRSWRSAGSVSPRPSASPATRRATTRSCSGRPSCAGPGSSGTTRPFAC